MYVSIHLGAGDMQENFEKMYVCGVRCIGCYERGWCAWDRREENDGEPWHG